MKAIWFLFIFTFSIVAFATEVEKVQFTTGETESLNARVYTNGSSKTKRPGVLIIEGHRNFVPAVPYNQLAQQLSNQGFVVLTYNPRGTGENSEKGSPWKSTFTSDSRDSQYALDFLKNHPKVNSKKLFVLGHCLGGAHALKLTEENKLAGVILVTSTIRSISDLQLEQRRIMGQLKGWNKAKVDKAIQDLSKQIQEVKAGKYKCVAPQCKVKDGVEVVSDTTPVPWWQEILKLDISEWALKSSAPIYFIFGASDYISPKSDYYYVRDLIRINKTRHIESRYLSHLDHFLTERKSAKESLQYLEKQYYSDHSKVISEELVGEISTWIRHKI